MINIKKFRKPAVKENMNVWDFNSISDLLKVVENIPKDEIPQYSYYKKKDIKSDNYVNGFNYFRDYYEAINALKYGWEHGRKEITSKIIELNLATNKNDKKIKNEYDVVGGNACVTRYLQNIPTNMIKSTIVSNNTKEINVYKSFPYIGTVSADEILNDAAKSVIIINKLEELGYKTNLYIVKVNKSLNNDNNKVAIRIKIKDAKMKLNLKKIAFCLFNPDMQRRIMWRLIELDPDLKQVLEFYGKGIDFDIIKKTYSVPKIYKNIVDSKNLKKEYANFFKMQDNDIFIPPFLEDIDNFLEGIQK